MLQDNKIYKPFIKWVWGKRQLLEKFKDFYPPEFNEYYEPFVWGWAVFFDLRHRYWPKFKAHLFDVNEELIITYNVVKKDTKKLIDILRLFKNKHSKDFFMEIRGRDRSPNFKKERSEIERAWRFIYLNRTWFNWMYRENSQWYFNVPMWRYTNPNICDEELLYLSKEALQNATIKKADFEKGVKKAKKWDFVYFDPPYDPINETSNFTDYAQWWFGREDQERLWKCFSTLDRLGCYVLASNNNTPLIKEVYKWFETELVSAKRMINSDATKRGAIKEIVIFSKTLRK